MIGLASDNQSRVDFSIDSLSRRLASAFREGDMAQVGMLSPAAACIVPILTGLGFEDRIGAVVEKFPMNGGYYDVTMMRNTLVALGVGSTPSRHVGSDLRDGSLPTLIETRSGDLLVVMKETSDGFLVFDASRNELQTSDRLPDEGMRLTFYDCSEDHPELPAPGESWWPKLIARFRSAISTLLYMTLFINLMAVAPPLFVMMVYDEVIGAQNRDMLPYLVLGLAALLGIEFLLRLSRSSGLAWVASRLDLLVSIQVFRHLLRLPPSTTDNTTVWTQLSLLRRFDAIRDFISGSNAALMLDIPFVLIGILAIAFLAGPLALIPAVMVIAYLALAWVGARRVHTRGTQGAAAEGESRAMVLDTLAAAVDIRRLGLRKDWLDRFRRVDQQALAVRLAGARRENGVDAVSSALGTIGAVGVLGWGAHMAMDNAITMGALVGVMIIIWRIIGPLQGLIGVVARWPVLKSASQQIDRLMRMAPEERSAHAKYLHESFRGSLTLRGVSFRHNGETNPVIAGLSAAIPGGQIVAITGASGTGKSTLLKILCGLYRPQGGLVTIDGVNLSQLDAPTLRASTSYLPHDPALFLGTVADNIRFSYPAATDQQVRDISEEVGILEQIEALPDGFDTVVGSSTPSSLTYGICLARTFIRDSAILLLDEPGAQLDFKSDRRLVEMLVRRRGKQTVLITTHRPGHVEIADQVLELNGGLMGQARIASTGGRS